MKTKVLDKRGNEPSLCQGFFGVLRSGEKKGGGGGGERLGRSSYLKQERTILRMGEKTRRIQKGAEVMQACKEKEAVGKTFPSWDGFQGGCHHIGVRR